MAIVKPRVVVNPHATLQHRPSGDVETDPAELMALLLELAPLRGLEWPPFLERFHAVTDAMHGGPGVSKDQVDQLRRWAKNWLHMHITLRTFYRVYCNESHVSQAIWTVLDGWELHPRVRGMTIATWTDDHGSPPSIDLFPRPLSPAPRVSR